MAAVPQRVHIELSVNGEAVSARREGGAMGVKPALSALKPDPALKPVRAPEE